MATLLLHPKAQISLSFDWLEQLLADLFHGLGIVPHIFDDLSDSLNVSFLSGLPVLSWWGFVFHAMSRKCWYLCFSVEELWATGTGVEPP